MNHKNVKDYLHVLKLVTVRLLDKWEQHDSDMGGRAITINDDMLSTSVDVASLVVFSQDLNCLKTSSDLVKTIIKILEMMMKHAISPVPYWKIPIIGRLCRWSKICVQ